jgi:hypothetical protein
MRRTVRPGRIGVNKVIARLSDGRIVRGMTADFQPAKGLFHVSEAGAPPGSPPSPVQTADLKALFFVKDLVGDPSHVERNEFAGHAPGIRVRVVFEDGEVLVGTTAGYQAGRPGFFLVPADEGSNIERCYVRAAATRAVEFL